MQYQNNLINPSKLLIKNIGKFSGENPLIVNFQKDDFGVIISEHFSEIPVTFLSFDYSDQRFLESLFAENNITKNDLILSANYQTQTNKHDPVFIYLPKSRPLIEYVFSMTADVSATGAQVFIVGENKSSIRSCQDSIKKYFGEIIYQKPGKHCLIYKILKNAEQIQNNLPENWIERYEVDILDSKFIIKNLPGVFSHGKMDKGTQFLLENPPADLAGDILDLGCGSGLISLVLKHKFPEAEIESVDVNALAVESTVQTLRTNGFSADKVYLSDVFSDVQKKFDFIISNPPFHTGIGTNYSVVENIFENAAKYLKKQGKLIIVANRFLKYEELIKKHIGNCEIIAENNSYRIYQAINV